jgi:ABC-type cobalt transport system substrate-binding protein
LSKLLIGFGATGGSILASYIPALWDGGILASLLFSVIGGIAGVVLAYRLGKAMDLF